VNFDDWLFYKAERLRDQFTQVLQRLIRTCARAGLLEEAIEHARRLLALDRLSEPAHRALMELYALAGRKADAVRQYASCARRLREDLDVSPDPSTDRLLAAIKDDRIAAISPALLTVDMPSELSGAQGSTSEHRSIAVAARFEHGPSRPSETVEQIRRRFGGSALADIGKVKVLVFGHPDMHENDPEIAVRAALAIRQSTAGVGGVVRIGVAGRDAPGPDEQTWGSARAATAIRLSAAARAGAVLVAENLWRLTRQAILYGETHSLGPSTVREAEDVLPQPRKTRGIGAGGPIVGRVRELALLRRAFRGVMAGSGRAVALIGEAGVGKSRLVTELRHWAEADPKVL
jgi:hypothetical protein